jgi:hypothetical protein
VRLIRRPRTAPTPKFWRRICAGRPAWTRRASLRSQTRTDQHCVHHGWRRAMPRRPNARGRQRVVLVSSWGPPTFQELGSGRHRMDDRNAVGIIDNADFQRLTVRRWSDEHRDVGIIRLEASPAVSECVEHVGIGDTTCGRSPRCPPRQATQRTAPRQHVLSVVRAVLRLIRASAGRKEEHSGGSQVDQG